MRLDGDMAKPSIVFYCEPINAMVLTNCLTISDAKVGLDVDVSLPVSSRLKV